MQVKFIPCSICGKLLYREPVMVDLDGSGELVPVGPVCAKNWGLERGAESEAGEAGEPEGSE
jgi:hypothetical protein